MKNEQKIQLADRIQSMVQEFMTPEDMPIMIGTLNKAQGVIGFEPAEVGHPVFEYRGRYIIYLQSKTLLVEKVGNETRKEFFSVAIPYFPESLTHVIDFLFPKKKTDD